MTVCFNKSLVYNLLYFLNILINNNLNKTQVIEKFEKIGSKISRTTINNYVKILKANNINILIEKINGKNYYSLKYPKKETIDIENISNILTEVKRNIIKRKNYHFIKNALYTFYKISQNYEKPTDKNEVANFGYYSNLNWYLINKLEWHCSNKNLITIEYILPNLQNIEYEIHADKLDIKGTLGRLYLFGIIKDTNKFSHLPVDRIFKIKNIIREKFPMKLNTEILNYTIKRELFDEIGLDETEILIKANNNEVTISRPVTDEFSIIQRLMLCLPDIIEISNQKIKEKFLTTLKDVRKIYD